jgi:hypothetical protein
MKKETIHLVLVPEFLMKFSSFTKFNCQGIRVHSSIEKSAEKLGQMVDSLRFWRKALFVE